MQLKFITLSMLPLILITGLILLTAWLYTTRGTTPNSPTPTPSPQQVASSTPQPTPTSSPSSSPATQNPAHPHLVLDTPQQNQSISSPLRLTGRARGSWFFEATFPVVLTDWNGLIIAEGVATAQGDWMTQDYVPFTADLLFTPNKTVSNRGSLILQKSNPSGLSENDDAYEITVFFE